MGVFTTQIVVGAAWLFWRPAWQPGTSIDLRSCRLVDTFGLNIMGMRVVDFATMRTVDILVLTQLGPASFGLFSVSWRLYQLLMQLFQAALGAVGLAMLSQIQQDRPRLSRVFVRSLSISAVAAAPPFLLAAALAREITHLLLGPHRAGAERIMAAFFVVGAVHCVICGSRSFLTAVGRPEVLLRLMLLKEALVLAFDTEDPALMVAVIAVGLLAEAPVTIAATLRALGLTWRAIARPVLAPLASGAVAGLGVTLLRHSGFAPEGGGGGGGAPMFLVGGATYVAIYAGLILAMSRDMARANAACVLGALRRP